MVLITSDLEHTIARLQSELGLDEGFEDEGVKAFGLKNRVIAAGDCFIEVLTPITTESSGHRYLERHGRDGGYMAIFQFGEGEGLRERAADLGIRIVWKGDLPDISGTHLDPRDVPGAIVSLDWADPPDSWHWAGPAWQGGSPADRVVGGVTSITVSVDDPDAACRRWAEVLGEGAELSGRRIELVDAHQTLSFVAPSERADGAVGIVECGLSVPTAPAAAEIGGVMFRRAEEH